MTQVVSQISAMALFSDKVTTAGQSYSGPVQEAEFTFSTGPEQLDFVNNFLRNRYLSEMKNALLAQGAVLLRLTIYRDTAPTWSTPYRCVATISNPSISTNKIALGSVVWSAIILTALALIIVYLIVRPSLQAVRDLVWGPREGRPFPWNLLVIGGAAVAFIYFLKRPRVAVR